MRKAFTLAVGLFLLSLGLFLLPLNLGGYVQEVSNSSSSALIVTANRALPLTEFATISSRPLFAKERRRGSAPSLEQEDVNQAAPAQELKATLLGVMDLDGEIRALISADSNQTARWRSAGERVEGWVIEKIDGEVASLALGDQTRKIYLYTPKEPLPVLARSVQINGEPALDEKSPESETASDQQ